MEERENGRESGGLENEREETEKREGERNPRAGKGTSLGVRALARQHTRAGKKFDYLSGRCRRQSGGSRMLAPGEWKDIVILRRHSSR